MSKLPANQANQIAEQVREEPASAPNTYKATRLPKDPVRPADEHLPIIAPSPKATIDYQTGKRCKLTKLIFTKHTFNIRYINKKVTTNTYFFWKCTIKAILMITAFANFY